MPGLRNHPRDPAYVPSDYGRREQASSVPSAAHRSGTGTTCGTDCTFGTDVGAPGSGSRLGTAFIPGTAAPAAGNIRSGTGATCGTCGAVGARSGSSTSRTVGTLGAMTSTAATGAAFASARGSARVCSGGAGEPG